MVIQRLAQKLGFYLLILLVLFFTLFPFVQMLSTSLKHQFDWGNPSLIPIKLNWDAYGELLGIQKPEIQVPESIKRLLDNPKLSEEKKQKILAKYSSTSDVFPFIRYFLNTFLISGTASFCSLVLAVFGAYSFSRVRYRGRGLIQRGVLMTYMFGGVLLMVPLYQIAVKSGLAASATGSIAVLIVIYVVQTLPVSMYMLGNYFRSIPESLEEAARIDGCSRMKTILLIILPLSLPMLVTVFIYAFMIAWNEYLFASVFLKGFSENLTLPIGLKTLFMSKNAIWDRIMAASMLTAIPVIILFMAFEKNLISGLTEGSVKE
ncbi:MAG: carbohydrate ABC transporter permease [SAR324 cluster bacterium]|jgi:multiple sugar transport system permease protein|nr:ABC transporter permease [Pseudomonadota bacterium]MBI11681.1 ABC transporter permease [Deltaproteobacteria bacterium]MDP6091430.1 carbohydrate ABC transporter permease [SAR324 cluster bacterium]MBP44239.1 ABC transporter permease [Deltaproteobacteria bacterium]MDP6248189.1 carbohydrate ABC transporter permease [SAR324 cluster bacterium]|tara:strand:+ start:696 stop:1652 length:957 start_codon:yes stop_codon:yes gene_type:complete